jgi:hypothetical protein
MYWVCWFIRFHALKHPKDMGAPEVEAFLRYLAIERKVSTSTHNVALSALLYLYKDVLNIELPWMEKLVRPVSHRRLPVVLRQMKSGGFLPGLKARTACLHGCCTGQECA